MLTATPAPPAGIHREYHWDATRFASYSHQPTQNAASVSLPSIRHVSLTSQVLLGFLANRHQQFPDLLSQGSPYSRTSDTSLSSVAPRHGASPAYVHYSPVSHVSNKRRRTSTEDEHERERAKQVPRLYLNPEHTTHPPPSPTVRPPPAAESWGHQQVHTAPPFTSTRNRIPAPVEIRETVEPRPSLPSLPPAMGIDRGSVSRPPTRDQHTDDYRDARRTMPQQGPPVVDAVRPRYAPPTTYEPHYRHPSQVNSTSPIRHTYERTPFSTSPYTQQYGEYSRYGDGAQMVVVGDNKQPKRRGNLPKETTDKLRAWFMAHVSHPYPTEDEKQELMRQTGLQMSKFRTSDGPANDGEQKLTTGLFSDQISNWFINARRRQLPTMISNARVESDAISGRTGDGKILPSTERGDMHGKREGLTLSDNEGAAYDEELESLRRHRAPAINRGSV